KLTLCIFLFCSLIISSSLAFQSDDEFGLEGANPQSTQQQTPTTRKRYPDPDSDSKVQFTLEHALGDSDFSPRRHFLCSPQILEPWRKDFNEAEVLKEWLLERYFKRSEFLPVSSAHQGKSFVVASVRADGANILAVSYGSLVACQYPRQFKLPAKWSFNSHTILKSSEQVPRTPIFTEEILGGENAVGEVEPPPERSFWAKYWMYLIPLGLVVMNAVTQATNMAEEQTGGQAGGSQVQQSARRR
ncbi:unnamed protein product, partial [Brassica oleracea]